MFNGLQWLETVFETLRGYVLGKPPETPRRSLYDAPPAVPNGYVHEPPEPTVSISIDPLPITGRMEVRPAEIRREAPRTGARKAPRAKKAATPKKKAEPTAARKAASGSRKKAPVAKAASPARTPAEDSGNAVGALVDALRAHPKQEVLVAAGRQKDQLLRSLIPLYLARALDVEVTSGTTSRFWGELGVTYAAPNAAKALRLHTGFAQDTKKGKAITSKGIKYVESALAQLNASDA
ncbi:hypothetical protein [Archangium minus]|uniref:hypothetical protein n=1 Tax=Archangium minus TaxID=83450 RepID=UPI0037C11D9A